MILIALLIYTLKLLAGFFLLHLLWDAKEPKALTIKLFLGAGLGAGLSSLLYFLWSWLTIPDRIFPFFELLVFVGLAFVFWRKGNWRGLRQHFSAPSKRTLFLGLFLLAAALICAVNFFILFRTAPHGIYDAWNIWNIGARFVYLSPNQWISAVSQNAWDHSDYPLLVTLNVADVWAMIGNNTTQAPAAFSLFFMLSLVGLLFSALWLSRDFEQGVLGAVLLLSLAELVNIGMFQYADIQLAYFFLATAALLYLYTVQSNPRFLFLAGLFAALAAWTKNEGNVFLVISIVLCFILSLRVKKNLLIFFVPGLLFPAVVILLFKSIAPANDLFVSPSQGLQQFFDLSRYQIILAQLWQKASAFGGWQVSFLLILGLYGFVIWRMPAPKPSGRVWLILAFFVLQFAAYILIYLMTPHDLYWHLDTSLNRLMFHVLPLLLFWLFTLLPSPQDVLEYREPHATYD